MSSGAMTTTVRLPNGAKVVLFGNRCAFWTSASFDPVYTGLIDNLPDGIKQYLVAHNHIEWRDEA